MNAVNLNRLRVPQVQPESTSQYIVLTLIGVVGLIAVGSISRNFLFPTPDRDDSLAQKSASPIADVIGGRSALGSFRYSVLPLLTILIGLSFFLLDDSSASLQQVYLLIAIQITLLIYGNLTDAARANIFGMSDGLARNSVLFASVAVILGVGGATLDPTTKNQVALGATILLLLAQGSIDWRAIATVVGVIASGFYLLGNRTNQALALIIGGVVAFIPVIFGEMTRRTLGIANLIDRPVSLAKPTIIDTSRITPATSAENRVKKQGATQRFRFTLPTNLPDGIVTKPGRADTEGSIISKDMKTLFAREGHFAMNYNPRRGEITLSTSPTQTSTKHQTDFTWSVPVSTPVEIFLSMGEDGLAVSQNGKVVARTANLTQIPETPANLVCGQTYGIAGTLEGLQFLPMPISTAQMTYFNFI